MSIAGTARSPKSGATFRLPHSGFNRHVGDFRSYNVSPDGRVLSDDEWAARKREWLPTDAERAHVVSLMRGVHRTGQDGRLGRPAADRHPPAPGRLRIRQAVTMTIGTTLPSWLVDRNIEEGRSDAMAFRVDGTSTTYAELQRQVWRAQRALADLGVRRGERVAMVVNDEPAFPGVVPRRAALRRRARSAVDHAHRRRPRGHRRRRRGRSRRRVGRVRRSRSADRRLDRATFDRPW